MSARLETGGIPQLHALTGIRGIAAWLVVLYHMRLNLADLLPADAITLLGKGYLAVDLFFMLSGFVMWLNYAGRLRGGGFGQLPHFWWKRFARVWPLHISILAVLVAFALALQMTGRDASAYPFAELPLHVLLVQNWGFTDDLSWNHPAWSISTELAAYLLFPFFVLALRWEKLPSAALIATALLLAAALYLTFAFAGEASLGDAITRLGVWRCLAEFLIGTMICNLWLRWRDVQGAAPICLAVGTGLLVLGMVIGLAETAFLPLVFALMLLALALDRGPVARLLGAPTLRWLGDVSYATYLAHVPLLIAFKIAFVGDDLQLSWPEVALYAALLLVLSGVLYHWLEKPAQAWLNAHAPRIATRPRLRA
ncbi:peptidoglycan/LPS O-acetylase OafA/YrhL [Altererythrobacter atlanticus]|uniref:O-acetyltransferase OatA n=1 Tax=Croceibacterium atlanticum TaxID=1267766 RepID=A0A0F7KWI1_9SPHN|nr:acyltransferase [Croceibacterium atlanticum]AKH43135.1 O-acetyltransferase OatA [Croceibacterium atlanticum]MBB5732161.1 peptidoglycan/LPS O-acetylase OafA/YrhL [Croceibacterium atlanticum]